MEQRKYFLRPRIPRRVEAGSKARAKALSRYDETFRDYFCKIGLNIMNERKTSFVLHLDMLEDIDEMTDAEKAGFLDFAIKYNLGLINLEDIESAHDRRYYRLFANQFDRDHAKWMTTKDKRREAGKKGGLAKASKASNCHDIVAIASDANHKGNVNVKEKVKVKENVNDKHRVENLEGRLIRLINPNAKRTELLEFFFSLEKSKDYDQTWKRKQGISTILNNLQDQLDLAFEMKEAMRRSQPKLGTPTQWSQH